MPPPKGPRGRAQCRDWEPHWAQFLAQSPDWDPPKTLPAPPGIDPSEFRDFWAFLQRFRSLRKRPPSREPPGGPPNPLGLPPRYDPQLWINLGLVGTPCPGGDPPKRHPGGTGGIGDPQKRHPGGPEDIGDPPKRRRRDPQDPLEDENAEPGTHHRQDESRDPPKRHQGGSGDPPKRRRRDSGDPLKCHRGDSPKHQRRDCEDPPKRHRGDSRDPPKHQRRDCEDPPKRHRGDSRDPPKHQRKDCEDPPKRHRGGDSEDPRKPQRRDSGDPPKHHRGDSKDSPKHHRGDPKDPPKRHRGDSEDPPKRHRGDSKDSPKHHRGDPKDLPTCPGDLKDPPKRPPEDPKAPPTCPGVPWAHLSELGSALLHYLDFSQRGSFSKLVRLERDRAALPIAQYRCQLLQLVAQHQVLVVAGDTGCGKSTQVPQYLLGAGYRQVCCAQPRRVACAALARRVGLETLGRYQVGFQTRFERTCGRGAHLVFVTLGLLLRQVQSDPSLGRYRVVVADEVHERHLPGDLLLGALRLLLPERPDLRLLLMSATCDPHLFAAYFGGAPVLQVPGRLYPIKVLYQPLPSEPRAPHLDAGPYLRVLEAIDRCHPPEERGDVLVFLSGAAEIAHVMGTAQVYARHSRRWVVLPLHSNLPAEQQDKVFHLPPPGVRKCILATNIAETSVTIDGVRFVVDSGKVKELRYDGQAQVRRLQESWISRASAEQRKGRAGRTGPGTCIRLYGPEHLDSFARYPQPEIHRVALDSLVLQVKSLGLGDPRTFPYLEAPPPSSLATALRYLQEQGALDQDEHLTPIGHLLAHLPVDVVVGKVLVLGALLGLEEPTLTVAAALSVPSPYLRHGHAQHTWAEPRRHLESPHGDPLTLLNLFNQWLQVKAERHGSSRRWCRRRGVAEHRLYEIADLRRQFQELLQEHQLLDEDSGGSARRRGRGLHLLSHAHRTGEQRQVLRLQDQEEEEEEEEEEDTCARDGVDIQALRFQLRHDPAELRLTCGAHLAPPQVALLGLVLARGLYPQVALPDPLNGARRGSEQVFHTRTQQGVALHPTGVFASRPELLQPQEGPGAPGGPSPHHQLVAFVSLLETTRPYLLTCLRVPALQVLLLCCRSLDTCGARVVADGWLELTCEDAQVTQRLLGVAVHLRHTWEGLLGRLLQGGGARPRPPEVRELTWALLEFLGEQVPYQLRQLTPLQRQHLYLGPGLGHAPSAHLRSLFPGAHLEPDPVKGGTKITEFLTWGCLASDPDLFGPCLRRFWTCPRCHLHLPLSAPERLSHLGTCATPGDTPGGTPGAPKDTCATPGGTPGASKDTCATPGGTPEGTWSPPEDTCAKDTWSPPEGTCARDTCAKGTCGSPEGTWSPPEDTCAKGTWSPPEDTCARDTCAKGTCGSPEGTWSPPEDTCAKGTWSPPEDTCARDTCAKGTCGSPEGTWSPPEDTCAKGTWSPPEGTCAKDTCGSPEGTWSPPEDTCAKGT